MFGYRRSRETNPKCMLVRQGWAKRAPINFGEIRPRESKPRSKYVWVQKVKGNESYIYMYVCMLVPWGWVKWAAIFFGEIRPRESKPRSKFVLVKMKPVYLWLRDKTLFWGLWSWGKYKSVVQFKDEGNDTHIWLARLGKQILYKCWFLEAERNEPQQVFWENRAEGS